jgi:3-oxoacyl-[acyl-carrier protein] reductase
MAVARTEQDLRSLARTAPVEYCAGELGTAEGCARIAEEATTRLGQIDILVNNVGVDMGERPIWDQDTATWRRAMAVNLDAPFELTRLLAGGMTQRQWGRIVMVSSPRAARADRLWPPTAPPSTGFSASCGRWLATSRRSA